MNKGEINFVTFLDRESGGQGRLFLHRPPGKCETLAPYGRTSIEPGTFVFAYNVLKKTKPEGRGGVSFLMIRPLRERDFDRFDLLAEEIVKGYRYSFLGLGNPGLGRQTVHVKVRRCFSLFRKLHSGGETVFHLGPQEEVEIPIDQIAEVRLDFNRTPDVQNGPIYFSIQLTPGFNNPRVRDDKWWGYHTENIFLHFKIEGGGKLESELNQLMDKVNSRNKAQEEEEKRLDREAEDELYAPWEDDEEGHYPSRR